MGGGGLFDHKIYILFLSVFSLEGRRQWKLQYFRVSYFSNQLRNIPLILIFFLPFTYINTFLNVLHSADSF